MQNRILSSQNKIFMLYFCNPSYKYDSLCENVQLVTCGIHTELCKRHVFVVMTYLVGLKCHEMIYSFWT
jgi:hypothetical protein